MVLLSLLPTLMCSHTLYLDSLDLLGAEMLVLY